MEIVRGSTPRAVDTESSILKSGRNYIVTASGGVHIGSWHVVSDTATVDPGLAEILDNAVPRDDETWRWD